MNNRVATATGPMAAVPASVGDDHGYREVGIVEDGTPLVLLTDVPTHLVYALGDLQGVSMQYPNGLGAPNVVLVREPFAKKLQAANLRFKELGYYLLALDAFRSLGVQAKLFRAMYQQLNGGSPYRPYVQQPADVLAMGLQADDTTSYANVVHDDDFDRQVRQMMQACALLDSFKAVCNARELKVEKGVEVLVTILRNLQPQDAQWDLTLNTAHGNGGAADLWLMNADGTPALLGVPFDHPGPSAAFAYFEDPANWAAFCEEAAANPILRRYLNDNGVAEVTDQVCEEIRETRRLFYNVLCGEFGLTIYQGECWHFNGEGSPCTAILKANEQLSYGVDPIVVTAPWGSQFAHEAAAEFGYN